MVGDLRCRGCGAQWLSLAGHGIVAQGDRCLHCGGELVLANPVHDNVGTVRQAWDRLLAGDVDGLVAQHHPEAEVYWLGAQLVEDAEAVCRGHSDIRRHLEECLEGYQAFPEELRAFGDRVLTLGSVLPRDGTDAAVPVAWIFRLRGDKILSLHRYDSPAKALRDLRSDTGS
jgi:ketosteroid isomerase-like protein